MAALTFAHHILLSKPSSFLHSTKSAHGFTTFVFVSSPFIRRHKSTQPIASSLLELGGIQISKQGISSCNILPLFIQLHLVIFSFLIFSFIVLYVVKDEPTNNVPDLIFTKLGLQLHRRDNHPLGILKNAIYEYF
ncbi:putative phenylalanine--tRNA ligase [Helianthus annuus]|uniref:Phenylalanine--tRNA ligase n=1 Tax=Helianthus annuus TaxID=4232 RepID=A0A251TZM7_HELAN|nr:putative phenylalanine--tRNA ligase [Helianthus annuus]KAJ0526348.1 putative phenylalanine--tRNA ligase [Helianthus annuus]KAJ0542739.1 putative phenylalanine--tRNA ligase [Helianthus annuus]KAJ0711775.1 putative phenylalanine--tRNA ligase [Helianthus annuus]KAJ0803924.1 putative phenylalanine--tRNA ligase [Helianthus annuus]